MAVTIYGDGIFGLVRPLPLRGFPEGEARVRIRVDEFVRVYIRKDGATRGFYVKREGDEWVPWCEIGGSQKEKNKS